MSIGRVFPLLKQVKFVAWLGTMALGAFLLVMPSPAVWRIPLLLFWLVIVAYVAFSLYVLFPRTRYAPHVVYMTLVLDVFLVGVLSMLLVDYLPNLEVAYIPFLIVAGVVADRRGVITLALFAAVVDFGAEWSLLALPYSPPLYLVLFNQFVVACGFLLIGLVVLFLAESIRRRSEESKRVALNVAHVQREQRAEAERTARRWEILNAVGLKVQQELQLERIYQVVADELKGLGQDFLIALWQEAGRTLRVVHLAIAPSRMRALESLTGLTQSTLVLKIRDLPDLQKAMAQRQAVFSTNTADVVARAVPVLPAELVEKVFDLTGVSRSIIVPIVAGGSVAGFFNVWGRDLSPADVPAVTGLAQHLALALDKARLLQRERKRAEQLALVSEIAERAVGMLDVTELLKEVTRQIKRRFKFEVVSVLLNDTAERQLVLRAFDGETADWEEIGYRQSWDVGLLGYAARTARTVVANNVAADPRYYTTKPEANRCQAELCVPLKRGDEVLGVLDVQSSQPDAFDSEDVTALEVLANQIAAIIEKGELFAAERKRAAQLALVNAIAERVSAILDPGYLLNEVVALIRERFGYYNVVLLTLEPDRQHLVMRAGAGGYVHLFRPLHRLPVTQGLIGAAARAGATIVVNDVSGDPRFYFPPGEPSVTGSEISIPLRIGHRTLGVLDIQTTNVNAFDASDVAALETLADQIAVALENARLYAQRRDEAEVKAALLRELSHRVKNNLTTVVGLLSLGLEDEKMPREEILTETLTRVQSIAVAHKLLADSPRARVDVLELSRRVLGDSIRQMTLPGQSIPLNIRGESVEISAHQAASLALVLNELVTNAIKHGGSQSLQQLNLCVQRRDREARLEFSNRSEGPANGFSLERNPTGLGLRLVRTLVEKDLDGAFTLSARDGMVFSLICFTPEA